jgi:iron complex outermembrane receptor protein
LEAQSLSDCQKTMRAIGAATPLARVENLTASVSVSLPDRHWNLAVYGRNLLDKVTDGGVSPLPQTAIFGGGAFRTLNEGRVVGGELRFSY